MMQIAKECLEKNGFKVIQGLMGVTSQERLNLKCKVAIPTDTRIKLINMACNEPGKDYEWIQADDRGTKFTSGTAYASHLRQRGHYQLSKTTIFKVMGSDTAIRFKNDVDDPTIIVARSGHADQLRYLETRLRVASKNQRRYDLFVCEKVPLKSFSSTEVRAALENEDWTTVSEMCPQAIITSLAPIWSSASGKPIRERRLETHTVQAKTRPGRPTTDNAMTSEPSNSIDMQLRSSWNNPKERAEAMAIFPIQESSEEELLSETDEEETLNSTAEPMSSGHITLMTSCQKTTELKTERSCTWTHM